MAYGACDACGCAIHECECAERAAPVTKKPRKTKPGIYMIRGDYVRVKSGHALAGAAGQVHCVTRAKGKPVLVEVRQLNGNPIRLPREMWEFVGHADSYPDVIY